MSRIWCTPATASVNVSVQNTVGQGSECRDRYLAEGFYGNGIASLRRDDGPILTLTTSFSVAGGSTLVCEFSKNGRSEALFDMSEHGHRAMPAV